MDIQVDPLGPYNVACIRHVGPYTNAGPIFGELWAWATERELAPEVMLGFSYDNPATVSSDALRYDVAVQVPYGTEGDDRVQVREFPELEYAQLTHVGSYEGIKESFNKLRAMVSHHDKTIVEAPFIELYIDDPSTTPEAECRTLLGIPVEPFVNS